MGTNYYFMSRNKELMQTHFAEKTEWGVLGEEYIIVDEPYLGYRCHLNKLSCGWRPLFQKHRAFNSFRKLAAFYREHQADLEIYDEYRRQYTWEEYYETVYTHSRYHPEPVKWVCEVNPLSSNKEPHLRTVGCSEEEAELYSPFNHIEYKETLQKFGVYERVYGESKYWNDPDYLFDWTEGEFM